MEQPVAKLECLACEYVDFRMTSRPVGDLVMNACPRCGGDMTLVMRGKLPPKFKSIVNLVNEQFYISDFVVTSENLKFLVESENRKEAFSSLLESLEEKGYIAKLRENEGELVLVVRERPEVEKSNVLINIVLFIATIGTTFGVAGYWFLYDKDILSAALFSFALLGVLGTHELGHKFSCYRNKVDATWPYFIPLPHPLLGTLGAVIKNKGPIPSKEALTELGASGPILGVLLAVPVAIVGLVLSQPTGGEEFVLGQSLSESLPIPLLYAVFELSIFGYIPEAPALHPFAWAGFIVILVTWLNLLPAGSLDGGHVVRGLLSEEKHFALSRTIGILLLLAGLFWGGFLIFGLFVLFVAGRPHPGALDDATELDKNHKILAFIALFFFVLCIPIPMWVV